MLLWIIGVICAVGNVVDGESKGVLYIDSESWLVRMFATLATASHATNAVNKVKWLNSSGVFNGSCVDRILPVMPLK